MLLCTKQIIMKKIILSITIIGAMLTSCSNETNVETGEEQDVNLVENNETVEFNTISEDSRVAWRAWHLGGVMERSGNISLSNASFLVNNNELTNVKVDLDMNSFTVESFPADDTESGPSLTGHLQSADFFDVENYPKATFEMTEIESTDGDYNSTVTGNLTIMKSTKSITFSANVEVTVNGVSFISENFIVDRADWNLTYNVEGTEGVPTDYIISNDLGFTIGVMVQK